MSRLVLLNGPPGVGKSTLASRYAADHPLTLNLDIDLVRAQLGGWTAARHDAGPLARDLAVSMLETHLRAGRDVVVPQYLGRADVIDRLADAARRLEVRFDEVVVMDTRDTRDNVVDRFRRRRAAAVGTLTTEVAGERRRRTASSRRCTTGWTACCASAPTR